VTKLIEIPSANVRCDNWIGGEWRAASGGSLEVVSPYTGAKIGQVGLSTADDVAAAVDAAGEAASRWRRVPIKERSQFLFQFRQLTLDNLEELANLVALESGKTLGEGRADVLKGLEVVEYALSLQNMPGGASEVSRGVTCEERREPLGVVAGIVPFNFPAMVPMWMFPIAITLGNAFVLKPSEKVPLASRRIAELMEQAGFPPGVFTLVQGDRNAAEALVDHPDVAAVGFVGSTPAARAIYERAATRGKRVLALGGAKNHLIVVPDADPEVTIDGVVSSFTGCAGQRCMAASLLVAVGDVDAILDRVVERAAAMKLGAEMGAIIEKPALERLTAAIDKAKGDGAKLRADGRAQAAPAGYEGGYWLAPTILDGADPAWECARKELFGPVLTIVRVDTLDDALALATGSPYGNATSVFTSRGSVGRYVAENATTGMVGINIGVPVPREPFSFGGTKDSRFGAGDITGRGGVEHWSYVKKITSKWELQPDANWMS
jgi:malonate-semialdehyde dehydrogenase (acetylating) / methylmalonate-semialdehyde dehydrogenase